MASTVASGIFNAMYGNEILDVSRYCLDMAPYMACFPYMVEHIDGVEECENSRQNIVRFTQINNK